MSFRLVEEVLSGMPADASLSERLVLVVLAHHADEQTRECWPGMAKLAARTGMHAESVRKALNRLESRGITLRSSSAARGHRTVYRVPLLPERPNAAQGLTPSDSPNAQTGLSEESPNARPGKPQRSTTESPNATWGPEGQEPSEPSPAREEPMMTDQPEPLDAAAALFSETHPGREVEALNAALAHERRRGIDVSHPAGYFATWSRDRRAAVKLAQSAEMAHSKQWCGHCDGPATRRVEDDRGNLIYAPNGTVRRCDCWSPRKAVA